MSISEYKAQIRVVANSTTTTKLIVVDELRMETRNSEVIRAHNKLCAALDIPSDRITLYALKTNSGSSAVQTCDASTEPSALKLVLSLETDVNRVTIKDATKADLDALERAINQLTLAHTMMKGHQWPLSTHADEVLDTVGRYRVAHLAEQIIQAVDFDQFLELKRDIPLHQDAGKLKGIVASQRTTTRRKYRIGLYSWVRMDADLFVEANGMLNKLERFDDVFPHLATSATRNVTGYFRTYRPVVGEAIKPFPFDGSVG